MSEGEDLWAWIFSSGHLYKMPCLAISYRNKKNKKKEENKYDKKQTGM